MKAKPVRMLLIEDDRGDARLFRETLTESGLEDFKLVHAERLAGGLERLEQDNFDIVFLDLQLPDSQGLDSLEKILAGSAGTPVVVLTGRDDQALGILAVQQGAQDYLVKKDLTGDLLIRSMQYAIERRKLLKNLSFKAQLLMILPNHVISTDLDHKIVFWNQQSEKLFGWSERETRGKDISLIYPLADETELKLCRDSVDRKDLCYRECRRKTKAGEIIDVLLAGSTLRDDKGSLIGYFGVSVDITERKQIEKRQELNFNILKVLNQIKAERNEICEILELIKAFSGFEAVGIRLRQGEDFPYYASYGFPADFIEAENNLCARDQSGELICDSKGNPYLECMCGNILCGRTDPTLPFFTRGGSFWTNGTTKLLASITEKERQTCTRNRCNREGYESVALIPLRSDREIVGLLQLNDFRPDCFTLEMIQFFEGLGTSIGIAFGRKRTQEALQHERDLLERIMETSPSGIIMVDCNGQITFANSRAEEVLGLSRNEIVSRTYNDPVWQITDYEGKPFPDDQLPFRLVMGTGQPVFDIRHAIVWPDGRRVLLSINATPMFDNSGALIGMVATVEDITKRMLMEEQLKESVGKYRELYDNAPVGYHELDTMGHIIRVNRTEADLLGYTVEEMLGRHVSDFIAQEERELSRKSIKAKFSGRQKIQQFDRKYLCKDGRLINCLIDEKLVQDDTGKILSIRSNIRDISELKKAEEQIKEMAKFPAESPDPVLRVDKDGRIIYANGSSGQLLKAWGCAETDFLPGEMLEFCKKALKTGKNLEIETRGGEKEFLFTFAVISESRYVNLYGRDITDRKQAEAERRLLETAFEQTAEAVIITDPEGNIIYTNPAFEKTTGYSRQEALGQNPRLLKSGQHEERFYKELWDTITAGQAWKGRLINKRKDGSLYTEEATISPVRAAAGRIANFVAVKRDITQELELENQLHHSQKMESIGLLAGGVAHDFNNILTTVLGYSSMMTRNQELPEIYRKWTGEIETAGHRGAEIAKRLLTFSRKKPPKLEPVDLNEIIKQSLNFLKMTIGQTINIINFLEKNLNLVDADSTQVQQIIMNLALNARDAMPEGGKIVMRTENIELGPDYIRNHLYAKPGPQVLLTFSDSGSGMDSETQKRIFEPFFTTKEIGKGTGLGLSVVYGIVKNHGGLINVYSEPGQGTTFKIYLPRSAGTDRAAVKDEAPVKGGHETVLVVDDEVLILNLVLSILEDYGYKCLTAENGVEAFKVYQENQEKIDLVLLDIVMPKMGGPEVFEKLKILNPGVKVIMSSGFSVQDEAELASKGVKAFVPKPYQASLLARKIREVLDHRIDSGDYS